MAKKRTVISQLTSAGESALEQLASSPVTRKALEGVMQVKDRVEKVVGSLGEMDSRVSALEKRLEALEKAKRSAAAKKPAAKPRPPAPSKS
jgi:phage shock protein A